MADHSTSRSARRRADRVRLGRITMIVLAALVLTAMLSVGTAVAGESPPVDACPGDLNPGVQAAGPCAVASVPDEAFVDPAIDVDRTSSTLAVGAAAAPANEGSVSPETVVATAAGAGATGPAFASGTAPSGTGSLPYSGLSNSSVFAIGMLAILFGALAYGEAGRITRRREVRTGA